MEGVWTDYGAEPAVGPPTSPTTSETSATPGEFNRLHWACWRVRPPLLRPSAVPSDVDPFERCIILATEGAEPGTLLWSISQDTCEAAVVLAPEQSREQSLPIILVAMLGLADGLGSLVPPAIPVTFGWPDRIEVNAAVVGGVRCASAPTATAIGSSAASR